MGQFTKFFKFTLTHSNRWSDYQWDSLIKGSWMAGEEDDKGNVPIAEANFDEPITTGTWDHWLKGAQAVPNETNLSDSYETLDPKKVGGKCYECRMYFGTMTVSTENEAKLTYTKDFKFGPIEITFDTPLAQYNEEGKLIIETELLPSRTAVRPISIKICADGEASAGFVKDAGIGSLEDVVVNTKTIDALQQDHGQSN